MRTIVPLGPSESELLLGLGSSQTLAEELCAAYPQVVVVSDDNVRRALGDKLFSGYPWATVPAGEGSKSLDRLHALWSFMLEQGLDRRGAVVAVGGGVVADLAGFAASTYMRGVDFYSVPTSLLAMVDASVGGKVGIDLPEGKNLVGQFYPAKKVAVDPDLLGTLPESEWSAGMAEVIKHAVLQGEPLWSHLRGFERVHRQQGELLEHLLARAVEVKVRVVTEDPYEKTGLRATLNLGHTYGHAIEWCSNFALSHGACVGLGLVAGMRLSKNLGLLQQDFEPELLSLLEAWGLPSTLQPAALDAEYRWDRMCQALNRDKKNKDGRWCFVLPVRVGEVTTVWGPSGELVEQAFLSLADPQ